MIVLGFRVKYVCIVHENNSKKHILKGRGHGNFYVAFSVPMFSLGDAKMKTNIYTMY